jgi:hypothetical protein
MTMLALLSCSGANPATPLPSVAASFKEALPSTASVAVYRDNGKWGDVIAVSDSDDRMAAGPTPGETWSAAQAWMAANSQLLRDEGFDRVLLCHSAVNVDPATGAATSRLSEMVPLVPGGSIVSVKTGQSSNTGNSTKIPCEG